MSQYTSVTPCREVRICQRCNGPIDGSARRNLSPFSNKKPTHCDPCILSSLMRWPSLGVM